MNKSIIVIGGPTASGKSEIALKLAKEIGGYIINADSRQIYKEISIGTAKPTPDSIEDGSGAWLINDAKHYLYGFLSIKERYSIYDFQKAVKEIIENEDKDLYPILVGGTGLYIDSVVYNFKLQEVVEGDYDNMDLDKLQELAGDKLDDLNDSDKENKRRVIQAIRRGTSFERGNPLDHKYFVVDTAKETLDQRIEERVERMFNNGLEKEVKGLLDDGFSFDDPGMDTIGYKEFKGLITERDIDDIKERIIIHTRQYAKRQRTWFKRNKEAIYIHSVDDILKEL